jgi:hypothetical protein
MRAWLFICASISFLSSYGQGAAVDSLIGNIHNEHLKVNPILPWRAETESEEVNALIRIGKPVTAKLVAQLAARDKGIISHHILTEIWKTELTTSGRQINLLHVRNQYNEVYQVFYNGLLCFIDNKWHLFTYQSFLNSNQNNWKNFIEAQQHLLK